MNIIKMALIPFTAIVLTSTGWPQSPQRMSYQAVIRDASNQLVTTQVGMRISILKGSGTGTAVYAETQLPTPNANGLVTIEIGGGTLVSGDFSTINWANDLYFIKTETATSPPLTTYTITDTNQLLSVPYTLYAKAAGGHFVGELYGGGIVVSVWKNAGVEHGLIASLTDLSPAPWSDVTAALAGAPSALDGQSNTNAIITQSPTFPSAAKLCADYTAGAFSDWYLPAIWELKECYNAEYIVNTILGTTDGFKLASYWSSTEDNANTGWYLLFNTGIIGSDAAKGNPAKVRAVRKF